MGSVFSRLAPLVGLDFGIQWACFAIAATLQTEKFYDFSGSCTYIALILRAMRDAYNRQSGKLFIRQGVNAAAVMLWAARLGSFLLNRIMKDGKDSRFDGVRNKPRVFLFFWTIQAVWIALTALPVYMLLCSDRDENINHWDLAGWTLWVMGFLLQVTADAQKSAFRASPENRTKFMQTGLWALSRHPNYFGEMIMWVGMWLSSSQALEGAEHVCAISPLFVYYLLRHVSGVPLLAKAGKKRWGNLPEYQQYLANTPLLVPIPPVLRWW